MYGGASSPLGPDIPPRTWPTCLHLLLCGHTCYPFGLPKCSDYGHFLDDPLAISSLFLLAPCCPAIILVERPLHQEGVGAGGVSGHIFQRSSQSHHQACVRRRREHRSLLAPGSGKYPHFHLLTILVASLELCAPAQREPQASSWLPRSSRNRLPRTR